VGACLFRYPPPVAEGPPQPRVGEAGFAVKDESDERRVGKSALGAHVLTTKGWAAG